MSAIERKEQLRIKNFWNLLQKAAGSLDLCIVEVFKTMGFNSLAAFKGHFSRDVDPEDFVEQVESFVQMLPDESELLKLLEIEKEEKIYFQFFPGHSAAIIGFLESIKELLQHPEQLQQLQNVSSAKPAKFQLTAANCVSFLRDKLTKRLNLSPDQEFVIVSSRTSSMPFQFKLKCFHCDRVFCVTISEDTRGIFYYNVRATKFVNHVKLCNDNN